MAGRLMHTVSQRTSGSSHNAADNATARLGMRMGMKAPVNRRFSFTRNRLRLNLTSPCFFETFLSPPETGFSSSPTPAPLSKTTLIRAATRSPLRLQIQAP